MNGRPSKPSKPFLYQSKSSWTKIRSKSTWRIFVQLGSTRSVASNGNHATKDFHKTHTYQDRPRPVPSIPFYENEVKKRTKHRTKKRSTSTSNGRTQWTNRSYSPALNDRHVSFRRVDQLHVGLRPTNAEHNNQKKRIISCCLAAAIRVAGSIAFSLTAQLSFLYTFYYTI